MTEELLIDIGGTAVKYGQIADGRVETRQFPVRNEHPLPGEPDENVPEKLIALVREWQPRRIGISTPGPFDYQTGTAHMNGKLLSMKDVALRPMLEKAAPGAKIVFLHDASAYMLGVMEKMPEIRQGIHAAVMLGTGLGYICSADGRVLVDDTETPAGKMWNLPYCEKTGEYYVSATALLRNAHEKGITVQNAKDMAKEARKGNAVLREIFHNVGIHLGRIAVIRQKRDGFSDIVLGGQVSQAFELMKAGYESACDIPLTVLPNPTQYPLYGVHAALRDGKENLYRTVAPMLLSCKCFA